MLSIQGLIAKDLKRQDKLPEKWVDVALEPTLKDVGKLYFHKTETTDGPVLTRGDGYYCLLAPYGATSALCSRADSWSVDYKIKYKKGSKNQYLGVNGKDSSSYHLTAGSGYFGIGGSLSNGKFCYYYNAGHTPQWIYSGSLEDGQILWLRHYHLKDAAYAIAAYSFDGIEYTTAYTNKGYKNSRGIVNVYLNVSDGNPIDLRDVKIVVNDEVIFRRV